MPGTTIRSVAVEPLNIPLLEPFTIATGSVAQRNVIGAGGIAKRVRAYRSIIIAAAVE